MICETKTKDRRAERRAMLRKLGLCVNCRRPSDGLQFCQACRTRYDAKQRAREQSLKDAGLCIVCGSLASEGRVRCDRCLEQRRRKSGCRPIELKARSCECCQVCDAVPNGYLCPGCVRLMANDALRTKAHSRCEEGGSLELDEETQRTPEYKAARALRVSGQQTLRFMPNVHGARVEPLELPEYSRKVFAESLHWEG